MPFEDAITTALPWPNCAVPGSMSDLRVSAAPGVAVTRPAAAAAPVPRNERREIGMGGCTGVKGPEAPTWNRTRHAARAVSNPAVFRVKNARDPDRESEF